MNLTPHEAVWLDQWFERHTKRIPSFRHYGPHFDATSWDCQECFDALREEALRFPEEVSSIVSSLTTNNKWPRLKSVDAFWMRERWFAAKWYCRNISRKSSGSAIVPTPPKDAQEAIVWLLREAWQSQFVDGWLLENARQCICVDDPTIEQSVIGLEMFFRKLEGRLPK